MDVSVVHSNLVPPEQSQVDAVQLAQRKELIQASKAINASGVLGADSDLVFVVDRATHRAIMRVVDRQTKEVIMQLPPEYVLNLAADLAEKG